MRARIFLNGVVGVALKAALYADNRPNVVLMLADDMGPWELYDMQTDKTETMDLSREHAEVAQRLKSMHAKWLLETTSPTIRRR